MRIKDIIRCSVAMVSLASVPGNAATINLIDLGGVAGSQAEAGFNIAAAYWGSMFTNNATINLGVGFSPLGEGIIGSTGSTRANYSVVDWESGINATKSNSGVDTNIYLPKLTDGGASFITNGVSTINGVTSDDLNKLAYDPGATTSSNTLYLNTSVIKAIGGNTGLASTARDGDVTFSSDFGSTSTRPMEFPITRSISSGSPYTRSVTPWALCRASTFSTYTGWAIVRAPALWAIA